MIESGRSRRSVQIFLIPIYDVDVDREWLMAAAESIQRYAQ